MSFEAFTPVIQSTLTQIVLLILGVLGAAALYYTRLGVSYLKGKIGNTQYDWVKGLIVSLVKSFKQNPALKDLDGAVKKETILAEVAQYCKDKGIPVTYIMLDTWLEEAVHDMNSAVLEITSEPAAVEVPAAA
jgi:hypothetical protein